MTIVITGGGGFVGSNLDGDYKVSRDDADLLDFEETKDLFSDLKPTTIIHAAAKHGNFAQIANDKVGYYRDNALISINVFEAARLNRVKNLFAFSSVTAFPDNINNFIESDLYKGEPHAACYPYAYSKRIIDVLCRAYTEQYNLNYNCMFLANAYGPGGRDNVIPTLIEKCLRAHKQGGEFRVLGDGSPRRDFIYIGDVKNIIKKLMGVPMFGPIILSSGTSVSIREIVDEIVKAISFDGQVVWEPVDNIGQQEKVPSNKKLKSLLPDLEFSSIRNGIQMTVEWFLAHNN